MTDYLALFAGGLPFPVGDDTPPGAFFPGEAPYPDIEVLGVDRVRVVALSWQTVRFRPVEADGRRGAPIATGRLLASLEGGGEVEIDRVVAPVPEDAGEVADLSRCAACDEPIPRGAHVVHDGAAYHRRCLDG